MHRSMRTVENFASVDYDHEPSEQMNIWKGTELAVCDEATCMGQMMRIRKRDHVITISTFTV